MRQHASGTSPAWDVLDPDAHAPELTREPPEREVQAPLDVCTEGAFQVCTLDANIDIHLSRPVVLSPSVYRRKAIFGQLETLLDTIRDSRSMIQGWNG